MWFIRLAGGRSASYADLWGFMDEAIGAEVQPLWISNDRAVVLLPVDLWRGNKGCFLYKSS